jgi:hypothetical protein
MLAYILALAVGLGSFSIYMAAFFFPEVHRKSDFAWSGVGLFYALVLWACAGRITGGLLLGQMAGVALLGSFGWQTLVLRRQVTPVAQQTPIPAAAANLQVAAAGSSIAGLFGKKQEKAPAPKKPKFVRSKQPKADAVPAPVPPTAEVKLEEQPPVPPVAEPISESSIAPEIPAPEAAPAVTEAVFVAETFAPIPPSPPESTPSSETPRALEISEIAPEPVVEPAESQTEVKQQPEVSGFESIAPKPAVAKESQPTPATSKPDAKAAKKSGGFGGLLGNFKNSLGGLLGGNSGKNKPATAAKPPATPSVPEAIAPEPATQATPAPEISPVQEAELIAAPEIAQTPSQGVPFPPDVATMAELMEAEKAQVQESEEDGRSNSQTESATRPEALERPVPASPKPSPAADESEVQVPAPPLETVIPEVVFAPPAEEPGPGDPIERLEVDVSATVVDAVTEESIEEIADSQLIRPNPPDPDLVEAAQRSEESKSENASGESKPAL